MKKDQVSNNYLKHNDCLDLAIDISELSKQFLKVRQERTIAQNFNIATKKFRTKQKHMAKIVIKKFIYNCCFKES